MTIAQTIFLILMAAVSISFFVHFIILPSLSSRTAEEYCFDEKFWADILERDYPAKIEDPRITMKEATANLSDVQRQMLVLRGISQEQWDEAVRTAEEKMGEPIYYSDLQVLVDDGEAWVGIEDLYGSENEDEEENAKHGSTTID